MPNSSFNTFLHCDNWKGGCKAKGHEDSIELLSVNHSMTLQTSRTASREGGLSAGYPQHDPVTITYEICPAAPKVIEALNTGQHIEKLEIHFDKPGGDVLNFLKITLKDVIVTKHQLVADTRSDNPAPIHVADLAYNFIMHEVAAQDPKGGKAGTVACSYSVTQAAKA